MTISNGEVFIINTKDLSYVFHVDKTGLILHDFFGAKIELNEFNIDPIKQKISCQKGTSTIYKEEINDQLSMDNTLLEFSFPHKGDYKNTPILLKSDTAGYTFDFSYKNYEIKKDPLNNKELPAPHDNDEELVIYLEDAANQVKVELHYVIFEQSNVIARNMVIVNEGETPVHVLRALSMQLDMVNRDFELKNFVGGWANEMNEASQTLVPGIYVHESKTGFSSHKVNPLFLLKNKNASEDYGDVFIFNLIYSGNHISEVELTPYGYLRVESGINPFCFDFVLNKNESFKTPYAVFTFSDKGINGARSNMHKFVNEHVIASRWKEALRPVVINNWEATYFKFTESKVINIAKKAKEYGAELFVLDDGWFSSRNDDSHGLGDYWINKKKLPGGLKGLAKKINKMGMKFGLWFEPESVNPQSDLYKEHPEWAIKSDKVTPSLARHQLLLDLSNKDVQDYIITNISNILNDANIEYIKWDMNRHMSDLPNNADVGEFYHRYILGLYRVLNTLTEKYPHVLFEGCASGGNRFDLGILSYCPQIWASDDTDAHERLNIQNGYLYGYPQSTLSNHVSSTHNHQSLREMSIDTRYNVACFGVLGYELIFSEMNKFERQQCKKLIEVYKKYRDIFQYGELSTHKSPNGHMIWQVVNKEKTKCVIGEFADLQSLLPKESILTSYGLDNEKTYRVSNVLVPHNIKEYGGLVNMILPFHVNPNGKIVDLASKFITMPSEIDNYVVKGSILNNKGLLLNPEWSASGTNEHVRVLRDFGSRLYIVEENNE